jgi:hypothetical protein
VASGDSVGAEIVRPTLAVELARAGGFDNPAEGLTDRRRPSWILQGRELSFAVGSMSAGKRWPFIHQIGGPAQTGIASQPCEVTPFGIAKRF